MRCSTAAPSARSCRCGQAFQHLLRQAVVVGLAQVDAVEVGQLGVVHAARGAADAVQIEQANRFLAADDLRVAVAPAESQQVVAQCLRQVALLAELQHADRAVALRQFCAVGTVDQRDVGEPGQLPAHGLVDLDLAERVGQVVVAADHVGDRHVVIVDHHGVQVGGRAVAAQDDHVVQLGVGDADGALHKVVHHRLAVARGFQADCRLDPRRRICRVAVAPASVVARRAALGDGLLAHRLQFVRRAVAEIGVAGGEHLAGHLGVAGDAGGLEDGLAVVRDAEPVEAVENHLGGGGGVAFAVGVLDAQQEFSRVMAGEQVVEQRGVGAADVQQAGRAGGEAGADGHAGHS